MSMWKREETLYVVPDFIPLEAWRKARKLKDE